MVLLICRKRGFSIELTAAKVKKPLSLGNGLYFNDDISSYVGDEASTINLNIASTNVFGGVIIDNVINRPL
jgi:hypothetical protein